MIDKVSLWNPLKNLYTKATIIYNKHNKPIEIRYVDGYIVKEDSYIEDILLESKIIKEKTTSWL